MDGQKAFKFTAWGAGYAKGKKMGTKRLKNYKAQCVVRILNMGFSREDCCRMLGMSHARLKRWLSRDEGSGFVVVIRNYQIPAWRRCNEKHKLWTLIYESRKITDRDVADRLRNKVFRPSHRARYHQMAKLRLAGWKIETIAKRFRCHDNTVYNALRWIRQAGGLKDSNQVVKGSPSPLTGDKTGRNVALHDGLGTEAGQKGGDQ